MKGKRQNSLESWRVPNNGDCKTVILHSAITSGEILRHVISSENVTPIAYLVDNEIFLCMCMETG